MPAERHARLDRALVARGLVRSRTRAQALIDRGAVRVDGAFATRASQPICPAARLEVDDSGDVSRAAGKLRGALRDAGLALSGRALDAGASTGGFTQVLLEQGCAPVYAVDVGHGQLDERLRADDRVVVREGLNLRDLTLDDVGGELVDTVVADLSFISLRLVLEQMLAVAHPDAVAVVLIKPQFEVGRERLGKGGVVRDPALRQAAVDGVLECAAGLGWTPDWVGDSRVIGQDGNQEIVAVLRRRRVVSGPD